ncbi:hypothetical protein ACTXT7_003102 [Hymenolepis weldensis]
MIYQSNHITDLRSDRAITCEKLFPRIPLETSTAKPRGRDFNSGAQRKGTDIRLSLTGSYTSPIPSVPHLSLTLLNLH